MEADWEFELGADAPVIDAAWSGFIDLRHEPLRIGEVQEIHLLPELTHILLRLNAADSPVWTCKCDVWRVDDPVDAFELDADEAATADAMACYIDLLPRDAEQWPLPQTIAADCKALCDRLRPVPLRCCRVDLVVRQAHWMVDQRGLGITAYFTGCGATEAAAREHLAQALTVFAGTLVSSAPFTRHGSPLQ